MGVKHCDRWPEHSFGCRARRARARQTYPLGDPLARVAKLSCSPATPLCVPGLGSYINDLVAYILEEGQWKGESVMQHGKSLCTRGKNGKDKNIVVTSTENTGYLPFPHKVNNSPYNQKKRSSPF